MTHPLRFILITRCTALSHQALDDSRTLVGCHAIRILSRVGSKLLVFLLFVFVFFLGRGGLFFFYKKLLVDGGNSDPDDGIGNWSITKQQAQTAVLANKGFLWGSYSMFVSTGARTFDPPATRRPGSTDPRTTCTAWMREACNVDSRQQNSALLFEFTRKTFHDPFPLPAVVEDVAMFLLSRGPFAWLGHNWMGCTSIPPMSCLAAAHFSRALFCLCVCVFSVHLPWSLSLLLHSNCD